MMNTCFSFLFRAAWLGLALLVVSAANAADPSPIKVMILTGQMNRYHNWQTSSAIFKRILEQTGRFEVEVVKTPPRGEDMSGFQPPWSDYAAVVLDYDGEEWPEPAKESFVKYMKEGGGLVLIHSSDNAFPQWSEFLEMSGVGGWGGRDESWGPKVRWRDGRMVLDDSPGNAQHPRKHDFQVVTRAPDHPIMRGLPERWMHANDELYSQLRGPAKNLQVLATASADPEKLRGGTGENEPMLMTIRYGEGRVFHTTLGHVGTRDQEPIPSVNCVGFITTLQRGTEWAATGKVTIPIPDDFPSADETSVRD